MKASPDPPPCWGGLLIYIYPMVIVFSMLVQCFITAWRVDHRSRARSRRRHIHHRASSRPRETREEARQRKYRYLYQVRTARGDIISQVAYSSLLYIHINKTPSQFDLFAPVDLFSWLFLLWNFIYLSSLTRKFIELCVGFAKACTARLSTAIGEFNQNQFTWTKYTQ